jgi:signal transduction histidine kinase
LVKYPRIPESINWEKNQNNFRISEAFEEMREEDKTKEQLIRELEELRKRIADLETMNSECEEGHEASKKFIEEEILKARQLESLGVLAGRIADDFNILIDGILSNVSFAKFYLQPESIVYKRLTIAEKMTTQAKQLARQLITFSKGDATFMEKIFVNKLIEDSVMGRLEDTDIDCKFFIAYDLWPVEADKGQIRQVILNMVENALDSMSDGGTIEVSAENIPKGRDEESSLGEGKYIRITIKDQGSGIPAEDLPKIFDPYFSTKIVNDRKGLGLGLSVCHSIIERHKGLITVRSEPGVGSEFNIYLPAFEVEISQ